MDGSPRSILRRRGVAAVAAAIAASAVVLAAVPGPLGPDRTASPALGEAIAVPVRDGHARFRLPTPSNREAWALVVSSLAPGVGSREVQIRIDRAEVATPIDRERPAPSRTPIRLETPRTPAPPAATTPARRREFSVWDGSGPGDRASSYAVVSARLRAVGRRVQVFEDETDPEPAAEAFLREVASTFDDRVRPAADALWGTPRDVDGDGRFTILLTRRLGRLGAGSLAADGYVRGADFDASRGLPFGNRCDMMYLNPSVGPGPYVRTLIAHEYTHAITFCRKAIGPDGRVAGRDEEGWLDEGLAYLVEDHHGFSRKNLDHRVASFLANTGRFSLVVGDYYDAGIFRSHGHRGAAYLFLRWCVDRHGPRLLASLIDSDRTGIENLEAATGRRFDDLFRDWTCDLARTTLGGSAASSTTAASPISRASDPPAPPPSRLAPGTTTTLAMAGTASRCVVVVAGPDSRAVEVSIDADATARLQVTCIPLADESGLRPLTRNSTRPGVADASISAPRID